MTYWLMKSEPDEFSIDDLKARTTEPWDGIRNYQARNFIREMAPNDLCLFYHSSCKDVGIAGVMKVVGTHYPDPLAQNKSSPYFDEKSLEENKWSAIDVTFVKKFNSVFSLKNIRKLAEIDQRLADFTLIKKGSRLSVMPVTSDQWQCLMENIDSN